MDYFLGVDIGATTVKLGLIDEAGTVVGTRVDAPSRAASGPQATMEAIAGASVELFAANNVDPARVTGVGASSPTPVSIDGICLYPTNIGAHWKGFHVRDNLASTLGRPTWLMNDGDAAGYREYEVRAAAGDKPAGMVQFITGTGLGGSIILNGVILAGQTAASELGHIVTDTTDEADRCGCGAYGCAETRASLTGLANIVRRRQNDYPDGELDGDPKQVARTLRARIQVEQPSAAVTAVWREYFMHIGRAARSVCNTIGAGLIVLSGGAQEREEGAGEGAWRRFLEQGRAWIREELTQSFSHLSDVRVEWAVDEIADSACYGAAAWARHQMLAASGQAQK